MLNQRHKRAELPSYKTLGDRRPRKRPNPLDAWCSEAGRLSSEAVQPWKAPNRDKYESSPSSCSTRHEVEGPLTAPSFPASALTTSQQFLADQKYPTLPPAQQRACESKQSSSETNNENRPSSHNFTLPTSLGFELILY